MVEHAPLGADLRQWWRNVVVVPCLAFQMLCFCRHFVTVFVIGYGEEICLSKLTLLKPGGQWSLYIPPGLTFSNSMFCPHSVFMCFVWIWEQSAIISLYSINWLVFIAETECLLRGTDWILKYNTHHCAGSGGQSPACHRRGPGSISGQPRWDLWWA